jgi:hypothetical protein
VRALEQASEANRHEKQRFLADALEQNPTMPRPVEPFPPFKHCIPRPVDPARGSRVLSAKAAIRVKVSVPQDANLSEFNFNGQTLEVPDLTESTTVIELKRNIETMLGLPPSKQKLSSDRGVLKNGATLAECDIVDGANLMISFKKSGGK